MNNMKKIFTLFFTLLVVVFTNAQSDFEIASSFMSKKGVTLVYDTYSKNRASASEDKPYSIFHGVDDKGFAIVKDGVVVGYSIENSIDEGNMPCALEGMLEGQATKNSRRAARNTTPIEPLVKSKWGQYEFAKTYLNKRPDVGICVVVAYAQLIHFWRIPQTYEEFTIDNEDNHLYGKTLITTFDHDKLLDEYKEGEYTQENVDEIAKFYFYINRIFTSFVDEEKVLNVEKEKVNTKAENRNTEFDKLLDKGVPFFVLGFNHAYVVDGRDSEGRYHANFGWGGSANGYYYFLEEGDAITNDTVIYTHGVPCLVSIIPKGWTSSVSSVKSDVPKSDDVYDIKGQKVGNNLEGLPNGVYIMDGKKHMVK